ncbi:MAG: restriction endonuclease subunit S [Deltaproteobacteria bacterium]|nr:MAG: restriction endonuclease subunit S [Deltaproteobacteria bacterium]
MSFKTTPLSDFVEVNPECITKAHSHDEIPHIDISSVSSGHFVETPKLLSLNEAPSRAKRIVRHGDTILATVRPNLRSFLFVREPEANTIASTGFAVLRAKENADPRFIYYAVIDRRFTGYLTNNTKGTSYPAVDTDTVLRGEIPDFNLQRQQAIASILSTYDDLIENNSRRIQLLEGSARLLYREWFVRLRFPGHEHVKIIDGVPEGWEKKRLIDIAELIMGQSPKSQFYNDKGEGLPFHQGVTNFGERFVEHKTYCTAKNRIAEKSDILCSVRAPVGRLNITLDRIIIGRGLSSIRSKSDHQSFLYYNLKEHFFKEDMIGGGAIFAAVTKKDMENQELLCPLTGVIEKFEYISNPIDEQIKILHNQNIRLKQARDLLLPRLMNEEIEV